MPKQESRRPGATGTAAGDAWTASAPYQATNKPARRDPAPWYRLVVAVFDRKTATLSLAEVGLYQRLSNIMHNRGEAVPEDHARLARQYGTTKAAFTKGLETLLAHGLIDRRAEGLWSDQAEQEAEYRARITQIRSQNASEGWEKRKQNQRASDANAYRDKRIEERGSRGGPSAPPLSPSARSSIRAPAASLRSDDESAGSRERDRPSFRVGATVGHGLYEDCIILEVHDDHLMVRDPGDGDEYRPLRADLGRDGRAPTFDPDDDPF
jgi:uncharacterized protein YdaU (DUF1376 family)